MSENFELPQNEKMDQQSERKLGSSNEKLIALIALGHRRFYLLRIFPLLLQF